MNNKLKIYPIAHYSKKIVVGLLLVFLIIWSCSEDKSDPYIIEKNQIGLLTDSTKVLELKHIFKGDSISNLGNDQFRNNVNEIDIFSKDGNKL